MCTDATSASLSPCNAVWPPGQGEWAGLHLKLEPVLDGSGIMRGGYGLIVPKLVSVVRAAGAGGSDGGGAGGVMGGVQQFAGVQKVVNLTRVFSELGVDETTIDRMSLEAHERVARQATYGHKPEPRVCDHAVFWPRAAAHAGAAHAARHLHAGAAGVQTPAVDAVHDVSLGSAGR